MDKQTFIHTLRKELKKKFEEKEVNDALRYYEEMIEDRKEQGEQEEAIIQSFGSIESILSELSLTILSQRSGRSSLKSTVRSGIIILAICASPVLLPIGIAFAAIFFGLIVAWISILFALAVAVFSLLFAMIPTAIQLVIISGGGAFEIVFAIAMIIISVALIILIAAFVYQYGILLLFRIIKKFSQWMLKVIRRKESSL